MGGFAVVAVPAASDSTASPAAPPPPSRPLFPAPRSQLPRLVKLANVALQVVIPHCLFSAAASSTSPTAFRVPPNGLFAGLNNTRAILSSLRARSR